MEKAYFVVFIFVAAAENERGGGVSDGCNWLA